MLEYNVFVEAITAGDVQKCMSLVEAGAFTNAKGSAEERVCLVRLCMKEMFPVIAKALELGLDINQTFDHGETLLHCVCAHGDDKATKFLIQAGANINALTVHGNTALVLAVHAGSVECVKALLEAGFDINAKSAEGLTALHYVFVDSIGPKDDVNIEVAKHLIQAGIDVDAKDEDGLTAYDYAIERDKKLASLLAK